MAKDFSKQAQTSIFDAVAPQGTTPEQEAQELREAQEAFRTQGREGMKMMRLSVAFTPSNEDYIRVLNRRKSVRDDERRSALHEFLERVADFKFSTRID